jgi:hypothetical protein
MPYLDNLMASSEQPIRRTHQHWFVLVANARYSSSRARSRMTRAARACGS